MKRIPSLMKSDGEIRLVLLRLQTEERYFVEIIFAVPILFLDCNIETDRESVKNDKALDSI